MKVIKIPPQGWASNSYIITADGEYAVVIDCAQPRVLSKCEEAGLIPVAVLLTHGHYDHVGGCAAFSERGVPIYCGEYEKPLVFSEEYLALGGAPVPRFEIFGTFKDGEKFETCGLTITVLHTAGHSAGGVCYLAGDCLFTGDTLFRGSVGRYDLPTGNAEQLVNSVKRLYSLDGDYRVYCGHDADTTLERERNFNMYVRKD